MELGFDPKLVFEEIKANQQRLDACKRHHFPSWPQNISTHLGLKVDCSNCGGRMDARMVASYTRGYVAAGGNPNDIIPGWSK